MKTIFYPGLGETKKNYESLSEHLIVADVDWNTGKHTPATDCDVVVSFSLGAVFSLDIALKRKLKKLILCSPTPFETLGKHKAERIIFIIGENEKFLQKVFKPLCKKNVKMIIVPKGNHRINKNYQNIILQNIENV
jgi:esterase/lipase